MVRPPGGWCRDHVRLGHRPTHPRPAWPTSSIWCMAFSRCQAGHRRRAGDDPRVTVGPTSPRPTAGRRSGLRQGDGIRFPATASGWSPPAWIRPRGLALENAGVAVRQLEAADDCRPFSPDGRRIATATTAHVCGMPPPAGSCGELPAGDKAASTAAFSPTDHRLLATGHGGRKGSLTSPWGPEAGTELPRLPGRPTCPDSVDVERGPRGGVRRGNTWWRASARSNLIESSANPPDLGGRTQRLDPPA